MSVWTVSPIPQLWQAPPPVAPQPACHQLRLYRVTRATVPAVMAYVSRSADAFYRYEFDVQGGGATLPEHAIRYYVRLCTRDRDTLRASLYRAWDATVAQNENRAMQKLTLPVLAIGGENSWGEMAGLGIVPAASDVQTVVIPGAGHWVAEQAPEQMLAALSTFLAPYLAAA